jgi:hypothetical protein
MTIACIYFYLNWIPGETCANWYISKISSRMFLQFFRAEVCSSPSIVHYFYLFVTILYLHFVILNMYILFNLTKWHVPSMIVA